MNVTLAVLGLSLYILIWEKLPEWGGWFNAALKRLPGPLQTLYEQWRCPYCVGFWTALVLHAVTGIWTLAALAELPAYWGAAAPVIAWFFDALATATLIYVGKISIEAIGLPAMKGYMMKKEFHKES
jgi:hypothetical protein